MFGPATSSLNGNSKNIIGIYLFSKWNNWLGIKLVFLGLSLICSWQKVKKPTYIRRNWFSNCFIKYQKWIPSSKFKFEKNDNNDLQPNMLPFRLVPIHGSDASLVLTQVKNGLCIRPVIFIHGNDSVSLQSQLPFCHLLIVVSVKYV